MQSLTVPRQLLLTWTLKTEFKVGVVPHPVPKPIKRYQARVGGFAERVESEQIDMTQLVQRDRDRIWNPGLRDQLGSAPARSLEPEPVRLTRAGSEEDRQQWQAASRFAMQRFHSWEASPA